MQAHKQNEFDPGRRPRASARAGEAASPATDEQLMTRLSQGDHDAMTELVKRYQKDIFRFCLHYVREAERARELAQETFIRVFTARERFDEARAFRPWILCIARNLCFNDLKRRRTFPMESIEEYASSAREESGDVLRSPEDAPDARLMAAERRALLTRAIAGLDEESREIVTLRFFERMQAKEIAEIVGGAEGAIRTRLHRILKGLRERYRRENEET